MENSPYLDRPIRSQRRVVADLVMSPTFELRSKAEQENLIYLCWWHQLHTSTPIESQSK